MTRKEIMQETNGSISSEVGGMTTENMLFTYDDEEKQQNEINRENASRVFSPKFIPFYPDLLDLGLTMSEVLMYGFIDFYTSSGSGRFYFTDEQLTTVLRINPKTVSRAMSKLKRAKLITVSHKVKSGGGTCRFVKIGQDKMSRLVQNVLLPPVQNVPVGLVQNVLLPPVQNVPVGLVQNVPTNNNKIKENKINREGHEKIFRDSGKGTGSRGWLKQPGVAKELSQEVGTTFLTESIIEKELLKMLDWLEANGKRYKNYKAFARNWLRRWDEDNRVKNQRTYTDKREKDWEENKKQQRSERDEMLRSTAELLSSYEK